MEQKREGADGRVEGLVGRLRDNRVNGWELSAAACEAADEIERLTCLLAGLPLELRLRSKMYLGKKAEGMKDAADIVEARFKQPNA